MKTFTVKISFGLDSDKQPPVNGNKEMAYNIGIALICVAALIGWCL